MSSRSIGSVIGGIFGFVYVVANAGALPSGVAWTARSVAAVALVGLVIVLRRPQPEDDGVSGNPFAQRSYALIVTAEVVALVAGSAVLRGPLNSPHAVIGWVSFVVGVHFIGLARVWEASFYDLLGGAIALCGVGGLVAAGANASTATIAVIAGLLPGAILLAAGYAGALARTSG